VVDDDDDTTRPDCAAGVFLVLSHRCVGYKVKGGDVKRGGMEDFLMLDKPTWFPLSLSFTQS